MSDGETFAGVIEAANERADPPDPELRERLVAALYEGDADERADAFDALADCDVGLDPVAVPDGATGLPPSVADRFDRDDWRARSDIATVVGQLETPTRAAIDWLCEATRDDDPNVRFEATTWLSQRPVESAVPALAERVRADDEVLVLDNALVGLARAGGDEAERTLQYARRSDEIEVPRRAEAAWVERKEAEGGIYRVLAPITTLLAALVAAGIVLYALLRAPVHDARAVVDAVGDDDESLLPYESAWGIGFLLASLVCWAALLGGVLWLV
jgi:hypothetical protein